MTHPLLAKLNIFAAVAVSTVLLAAFGVISLFEAVPVMVVVFVFGIASRTIQSRPRDGRDGVNG